MHWRARWPGDRREATVRAAKRSTTRPLLLAAISLVVTVATGVDLLGKPLRLVHLLTIIGLSVAAGVAWAEAIWRVREHRSANGGDTPA
jgi:hypothetical protein